MPDTTPNLTLPYILPAQAQKHVTHNEALQRLDLLAQLRVQSFGAETPPATPLAGQVWALGANPVGDWSGQGGQLAARIGGGWSFIPPREGWCAFGLAEGALRIWRGAEWRAVPLDHLEGVGVNTGYDATNRLAVAAPATLLTHEGAGHQLKINKASAAQTASLLFQSNWSGRAEMGLAGSDDFAVKVSADGAIWTEALRIARATGAASLAAGTQIDGKAVYHRGNTVGTVSQSAGLPTGAICERGTTATGSFVRFADGTQICTHTMAALGSGGAGWTFPAPFAAAPVVTGTAQAGVLAAVMLDAAPTVSAATLSVRDKLDARRADPMHLTAKGRWF